MFLKSEELVIRQATIEDCQILMNWWNDGNVMAHAGFPNGLGITKEAIKEKLQMDSNHKRLMLELNQVSIGEMSYREVSKGVVEIGIKICEASEQGKEYGTRYLKMLIHSLFEKGYEKIILDTNLNNLRAQHVYEKIGFKKVSVNMDSWKDQLGQLQSSVDYELYKNQFDNGRLK